MTVSHVAMRAMTKKIIDLTEKELEDGKYEGNEKRVREILDAVRKLTSDNK